MHEGALVRFVARTQCKALHSTTALRSVDRALPDSSGPHTLSAPMASSADSSAAAPAAPASWTSLGLAPWVVRQCESLALRHPTDVQTNCLPAALRGEDVIGCAPTGSGKTAAFALPVLNALSEDPFGIFALVMTPTRELAFQIGEQFTAFGAPINVRCEVVVGGVDMMQQAQALSRRPHILVCTPGRLVDHLRSSDVVDLSRIKFLVLDEADRLLDDSFGSEMECILGAVNEKRQTLLFSATMTQNLRTLRELSMEDAFCYDTGGAGGEWAIVEHLKQEYILMPAKVKDAYLVYLLKELSEVSTIIFTASCKSCELLHAMISSLDIESVALHSRLSQANRLRGLSHFKSSRARVLVATDVGSRGLDIPRVELVLNYNIPAAAKEYIHRVGRTARAGRSGRSISLVTQYDVEVVQKIEALIGKQLEEYKLEEDDVLEYFKETLVAKRKARMQIVERSLSNDQASHARKHRKRKANWASSGGKTKAKE